MRFEAKVAQRLITQGKTLAVAESCTGGLLSSQLTNIPGSSDFFLLGAATYSNAAKHKILKVPKTLLSRHGAVSRPVALSMARGVRKILDTDYGVAITGIAGPGGGSKSKPIGLTYIAIATKRNTICKKHLFKGSRLSIKRQASTQALKILLKLLT